jgi:uncharacterized protein YggE
MSKAQVIAQALGGKISHIVEVQEGDYQRPVPVTQGEYSMLRGQAQASTPLKLVYSMCDHVFS